jgi:hypothetical protein
MSVLFTIELRVDCGDAKKYLLVRKIMKQVALQAHGRVALMDDGRKPEVIVSAHTDDGDQVNIPLVTFARTKDGEVAATNARLPEALGGPPTSRCSRPALRVINGQIGFVAILVKA